MKEKIQTLLPVLRIVMGILVFAFTAIELNIRHWNAILGMLASGMFCIISWSVWELFITARGIGCRKRV